MEVSFYNSADMSADGFSRLWAAWLAENFDNNQQIAKAFGVSERQVQNWLSGDNGPRGWHVGRAVRKHGFLREAPDA